MKHYIHRKCGGRVSILSRRCSKCRQSWPISTLWIYPVPEDLQLVALEVKTGQKATYSKWADRSLPGVSQIAGMLPNWPRWKRITFASLIIVVAVSGVRLACG